MASRAAAAIPLLGRLTVGDADGHGVLIGYRVSNTPASEILSWNTFAADRDSGRLPRSQEKIGIITVGEDLVREERRRLAECGIESKVAVAWALGEAVMVGAVPGWDIETSDAHTTFGMRIGPEPLSTALALWLPDNRVHVPETGFTELRQTLTLEQVPKGVPIY